MIYNIYFEIGAFVNAVVVLCAYSAHKKLPETKNTAFLLFSISMFAAIILNLLSAYLLSYAEHFPIPVLYFVNCLYYFFIDILPITFAIFAIAFAEESVLLKKSSIRFLIFGSFCVQLALTLLTPFFHVLFQIDENHIYTRQFGLVIFHIFSFAQILTGNIIVARSDNLFTKQNKKYFFTFISFTIVAVILDMLFPKVLLQDYGISISVLLFFYALQDKDVITSGTTGLLNQKAFMVLTTRAFRRKEEFCVVSIYIDDLQFLTTTFGIEGINNILISVGVFLKELVPDYKVFQLSEETFCVMIPNTEAKNYSMFTTECLNRFSSPWKGEILEIKLNARLCVIRCPDDAENSEAIFETIRTATEDSRYKNGKLLFADKIDVNTKKRYMYVEQLVRTAIQERRIEVYYQPLYSISEQRIIGAEALVRMRDHDGNFISPDEFVPIAEQNGMILRIGMFVYEDVCRFISSARLKELGIQMIDVNLSVAQCMQTRICEELLNILNAYNLDTSIINLEITETAAAHNPELLYSTMEKLSAMGFSCSLDDYGTGYANLNYILHMAFSMVKIDKDIVWNAMNDVHAYIILIGIIDMIHKLNMKVVAEGIETQDMVDKLTKLNCDYLQGYYYSRPIPEKEFYELVKNLAVEKGLTTQNFDEIFPESLYPVSESLENDSDDELDEDKIPIERMAKSLKNMDDPEVLEKVLDGEEDQN